MNERSGINDENIIVEERMAGFVYLEVTCVNSTVYYNTMRVIYSAVVCCTYLKEALEGEDAVQLVLHVPLSDHQGQPAGL